MLVTDDTSVLAWQDIDDTVRDAASRIGNDGGFGGGSGSTSIGAANVFAIHWVPTDGPSVKTIIVIPTDARGHLLRYWMAAGNNSALDCQHAVDGSRVGQLVAEGGAAWPWIPTSDSTCQLAILGDGSNRLAITLSKAGPGADSVYFFVRVDDFGIIPSDGYQGYTQD